MKRASMMSLDYRQGFTTMRHIILNEHIDDRTPFYSCRFRVTGPIWLEAEDEVAMTSDGGRLVVIRDGSECWFEFTPPEPLTIKDFGRWVLSPIATLASIITSNPADGIDLYARLRAESPWRQVHRPDESELPRARRELLSTSHLSSERFVRWIDLRKRSGALDAAAIDDFQGVSIQTEVLTLAAVAEGLHRRIFDGRKCVPAISTEDLAETRRAARGAALACLRDLDRSDRNPFTADDLAEFKRAMNDSFAFMNELTFRTRMAEIASTAKAAIPDIVTAFADWPKAVKDARNILAHQRALPYSESIDQFYDLLIALTYSIAWVLRTVLLVEAGIDAPTLQAAYRQWSQYTHHLANTRSLLAGSRYAAS